MLNTEIVELVTEANWVLYFTGEECSIHKVELYIQLKNNTLSHRVLFITRLKVSSVDLSMVCNTGQNMEILIEHWICFEANYF